MLVETYECEETAEETPEMASEAAELIEKLGLAGQEKLLKPNGDGDLRRFPYRQMTAEERFVYRTVCPKTISVKAYDRCPIPVRVLQVVAHVMSLEPDWHVAVWDHETAEDKDPVLVASASEYGQGPFYLLARWGEELDEWPAMVRKATERHREKLVAKCREIINKATARLNSVPSETMADWASSADGKMPSFYD